MRYFLFILAIFCTSLAQAKVYQWVDENGRVHFSDKPPAVLLEKEAFVAPSSSSVVNPISKRALKSTLTPSQKTKSSNDQILVLQIRQLFEDKKYSLLNSKLEAARIAALNDVSKEVDLVNMYRAFSINSTQYTEQFNAWVNAYPVSYQPFLARAKHYQVMGWKARGDKWGSETTDKQRARMKSYFVKATADIEKALHRNPKSLTAHLILIDLSHATSSIAEAENIFREALKVSPSSYEIRRHYIRRLRPRWGGSTESMLRLAEESLQQADQNPELINLSSWILEDFALSLITNGNYTLAVETLDKGLSELKNLAIAEGYYQVEIDHFLIFKQGYAYFKLENYDEALNYLDLAIKRNENVDEYYYWRSKIKYALKDYIASSDDLLIARSIDPFSEKYNSHRDRLISRLVYDAYEARENLKYPKALQLLNMALKLDPYKDSTLRRRAYLYMKKGQIRQAKQDADSAIELSPLEYENYKVMDDVLVKQRRFAEIVQYWDKYIALKPKDSRAFFERSGTYFHLKRIDLAMKDAKQASALGHPNAEALYQSYQRQWSRGQ